MEYKFWKDKKVVVTGGKGFLGSYVLRELKRKSVKKVVVTTKKDNNLLQDKACLKVTKNAQIVLHLAGNVGGIGFNQRYPGTLFYDNLMMGVNIIEACRKNLVGKVVIVGTICSYPKYTPIPFKETDLWNGYPEETNAPYGIAKKALIVQSKAYHDQYGMNILNLLPVNLYGPGDHFESHKSHVIPALIKKFVDAKMNNSKEVVIWGTGNATREFFYVEDAARAIIEAVEKLNTPEPVNIGAGTETSIRELAMLIKDLVGYEGELVWDTTKPDGQPRRMLDISKAKELFDFEAKVDLKTGLKKTIDWYISDLNQPVQLPDSGPTKVTPPSPLQSGQNISI